MTQFLLLIQSTHEPVGPPKWQQGFQMDPVLSMLLGLALGIIIAGIIFNLLFGKHLHKKKKVKLKPLEVQKIIVDEDNVRGSVRVVTHREVIFQVAHFPEKQQKLPDKAITLDLSYGGLAFASTLEFPKNTDVTVVIRESAVAISPPITGNVVLAREFRGDLEPLGLRETDPETGRNLDYYMTSVKFKNLSDEARNYLNRLITELERKILSDEKAKREEELDQQYDEKNEGSDSRLE